MLILIWANSIGKLTLSKSKFHSSLNQQKPFNTQEKQSKLRRYQNVRKMYPFRRKLCSGLLGIIKNTKWNFIGCSATESIETEWRKPDSSIGVCRLAVFKKWIWTNKRFFMAEWTNFKIFTGLHIEALRQYTIGIRHENALQISFITGALRTLRSLGHRERMYQVILR